MSKNYQQRGEAIDVVAPYDVPSGGGLLIGTLFGVAQSPAETGDPVVIVPVGVWELAKTSAQAWTVGAAVYWNNTDKVCTTSSSGNSKIGVAVAVAANPSATGQVLLRPGVQ